MKDACPPTNKNKTVSSLFHNKNISTRQRYRDFKLLKVMENKISACVCSVA